MGNNQLSLYTINMKYVRDLHNADDKVQSVSPQIHKSNRPFVGVVMIVENKQYCIPLDSPKQKHQTMKNDIDFSKIIVEGKMLGVLNINNMVPVDKDLITKIDLRPNQSYGQKEVLYKNLCRKELDWIQKHAAQITAKANRLYGIITSGKATKKLSDRCLDFEKLEAVLLKWKDKKK